VSVEDELAWLRYTVQRQREQVADRARGNA